MHLIRRKLIGKKALADTGAGPVAQMEEQVFAKR